MKGTCTKLLFLCVLSALWLPAHRSTAQTISTLAGSSSGISGSSGDGGPATEALLRTPTGVALTAGGAMYLADHANNKIRLISPDGIISTFAGNGVSVYAGDGGPAIAASIRTPYNVAVDAAGNVYIADQANHRIRKVDHNGLISTVAGNGTPGYNGDNIAATAARINSPYGIALDAAGNIYFSEYSGNRIRKVDAAGIISTIAGDGLAGFLGHLSLALTARFNGPAGITLDHNGHILVADMNNNLIRRVEVGGNISTVAGNRSAAFSGDGGPAVSAALKGPTSVAEDVKGNLYIADKGNNRIRKVSISNAAISTIAGAGLGSDNGPALTASLSSPHGLAVDEDGNIFVAEYGSNRIRKIEGFVHVNKALNEGATTVLTSENLMFPATTRADADIVYTLNSIPGQGLLFRDADADGQPGAGEILALAATFTQADILAQTIRYQHDGSESGSDQFNFSVSYGSGKTLSGRSFAFTVEAVNDAPVISLNGPASFSTGEDQDLLVPGIQVADVEAAQGIVTLELSVNKGTLKIREDVAGGLSASDIYGNNSRYVALVATLDAINATFAQEGLVYQPDQDSNGADALVLMLSDNGLTGAGGTQVHQQVIPLAVEPVNDQPLITSNGGGEAASLNIDEKTTAVTTVTASDVANENSTLTYSLAGGADQALFAIEPQSGALSFVSAPDFRLPGDADADNTYLVKVRVTDDGAPAPYASDEQEISVTVLDKTLPRVTSILRLAPAEKTTKTGPLVFQVTFEEAVSQVDAADFRVAQTGTAVGSIAAVSAAEGSHFDVTLTGVAGDGTLGLEVDGSAASITDAAGLALAESFAGGEAYTIDNTAPVISGVEDGAFYATDRQVSFNEGTATLNGSPFAAATLGTEGHYTLVVTDAAGNASTLSFDIDKTAPSGTLVINAGETQTRQTGVSLALSTADGGGSQTAGMRFSPDNSTWTAWEPYAPSKAFELPAGDGGKTVYLQLRDAVGNVSASISDDINLDQTLPTLAMSSTAAGDSVNAPFPVALAFSEDVAGFAAADLVITNGSASGFTALDARHYTVLITPAAEGWTKVGLPEDRAQDQAGNGNEAAGTLIRFFDATSPGLAISGPAASLVNAPFTATFTFSEPVSGFAAGDIEAGNATVSNFQAQNEAVYTATISPLAQGPVTVAAAAGAAADPAGNASQAGPSLVRNFDDLRPVVSISAPAADPVNAAFTATVTFSEAVTGFEAGDLQVSNGTVSGFTAQSATVYTALISPAADGQVTIGVGANAAADAAANGNEAAAALSRTYDATLPVLVLSAAAPAQVNAPFPVSFSFSEPVTGFDAGDIGVGNGAISNFQAQSASVYSALIIPAVDGPVSVAVAAAAAADAAGNGNGAAAPLSRTYDATPPGVTLASTAAAVTNASSIPVSISFTEAVSGFVAGGITVSNGAVAGFTALDAKTYQVLISPLADGPVTVQVAAQVAADAAGNANTASGQLQRLFDGSQPQVAITSPAPAWVNAPFPVSFAFNEPVTGFSAAAVTVVNASLSTFTALSATQYTATLSPSAAGQVSVTVEAGKAFDAAANGNQASQVLSRNYDAAAPTVTLASAAAPVLNAPFQVQVNFSEAVTGFGLEDIAVSNGQASNLTQTGTLAYSALITPAGEGPVQVQVAAAAAADQAGNASSASVVLGRTYDATRPAVVLASPVAAISSVNPIPVSITFSEPVRDFVLADILVTGGTAASLTGSGTTYQIQVVPAGDGIISVQVAAGVASDPAGNGNLASSVLSRTFDGSRPAVVITALTNELIRIPFVATITFSEPVTGFVAGDLGLTNATASNFQALSASVYTVLVTPAPLGTVLVKVPENVAADQLQNGNLAAVPLVVEDVRCGNRKEKILICHKGQMICVSLNALAGHLGHGDNLGSCTDVSARPKARMEMEVDNPIQHELALYPNPAKAKTNIDFILDQAGSYRLALYDGKGTLLKNIAVGQGESQEFISRQLDVRAYPQGVYLIRLTTPAKVVTRRLLIEK